MKKGKGNFIEFLEISLNLLGLGSEIDEVKNKKHPSGCFFYCRNMFPFGEMCKISKEF